MALTPEQQADLDFQKAMEEARSKIQTAANNERLESERLARKAEETLRAANQLEEEKLRAANQASQALKEMKLEMVRTAKEILVENRRTKPASEATDITVADVTGLAEDLTGFVNS